MNSARCMFLHRRILAWVIPKRQPVTRSKHSVSVIQTSRLMLYREIMAVCSEIHTKHINTLCGEKVELLNVKLVVHYAVYSDRCAIHIVTTVWYI